MQMERHVLPIRIDFMFFAQNSEIYNRVRRFTVCYYTRVCNVENLALWICPYMPL
jgi:hypothetical protein